MQRWVTRHIPRSLRGLLICGDERKGRSGRECVGLTLPTVERAPPVSFKSWDRREEVFQRRKAARCARWTPLQTVYST